MIKHNGKNFYSAREIARHINTTDDYFSTVWKEALGKEIVSVSKVSEILTKARENNLLSFVSFRKSGEKKYYAYSLEDVKEFLSEKIDEYFLMNNKDITYVKN